LLIKWIMLRAQVTINFNSSCGRIKAKGSGSELRLQSILILLAEESRLLLIEDLIFEGLIFEGLIFEECRLIIIFEGLIFEESIYRLTYLKNYIINIYRLSQSYLNLI
jgi:hypothetical protein